MRSGRCGTGYSRSHAGHRAAFDEGRRRKDGAGDGDGGRDGRGRPRPRPAGLGMPLARSPGGRIPSRYRRRAGAAPADPRCGSRPARGHRCSRYAAAVGNGRARGRPGGRPGDRSLPAPDSRPGDGADNDPGARLGARSPRRGRARRGPAPWAAGRPGWWSGNSTYGHIGRLPNPENDDVVDIAAALQRLGFDVTTEARRRPAKGSTTTSRAGPAATLCTANRQETTR